jgi:hypothetical protein
MRRDLELIQKCGGEVPTPTTLPILALESLNKISEGETLERRILNQIQKKAIQDEFCSLFIHDRSIRFDDATVERINVLRTERAPVLILIFWAAEVTFSSLLDRSSTRKQNRLGLQVLDGWDVALGFCFCVRGGFGFVLSKVDQIHS